MATDTQLKTASVLAFERKLDPSDGVFHAGKWAQRDEPGAWLPIEVREKSVRGTISNRLKATDVDPAALDADVQKPNLQTVDVAALPVDADTLRVTFTLRVLSGAGTPNACNNAAYQDKLLQTVQSYAGRHGFGELARRYACNLANGRFLWRNRVGAEQVEVRVRQLRDGAAVAKWAFDALALSLKSFDVPTAAQQALSELSGVIRAGLSGEHHVLLEVTAFVRLGNGQEVFPSQEFVQKGPTEKENSGRNSDRSRKSKTLYSVDGTAGLHSQKIGNALRTIDTWHKATNATGPIAVEPYGSVTTRGMACRQPKTGDDFYTLLDRWLLKDRAPEDEQQHFVMATLIRGGVFGKPDKE